MTDALDVDLVHRELLEELELTVELIVVVSEATEPLAQQEIDRLLGSGAEAECRAAFAGHTPHLWGR